MISRRLKTAEANFMGRWTHLSASEREKGICTAEIESWIHNSKEVVNILMPLLGWEKIELGGDVYWFEERAYLLFMEHICDKLIK